jgi:prophage DNA circulation protein
MTGGRRIVKHEFPERDDAKFEDLGRRNRGFNLSAYILPELNPTPPNTTSNDYYGPREELIDALEEEGAGTLVHPYRGEIECRAITYTVTETTEEGRMCRVDIVFERDDDARLIIFGPSPSESLSVARQSFFDEAVAYLDSVYDVASQPAAVVQDAINVTNDALDVVQAAKRVTGTVGELENTIDGLRGNLDQTIFDAQVLGQDLVEIVAFGTDPFDAVLGSYASDDLGQEQYSELKTVTDFEDEQVSIYPAKQDDADYPPRLIQQHIARVALSAKAGMVSSMTIENSTVADEILSELDKLVRKIEDDENVSDELYAAARDLRRTTKDVIDERKLSLERLIEFKMPEFDDGLSMSYQYYSNTDRDLEIAELNQQLHPGFIPGGRNIKLQVE